ncbi:MAG: hypothetical protein KY476_00765 [Planctomycetes bacterium]|nr:hypothetical protein [Planctomycetota bacterium]
MSFDAEAFSILQGITHWLLIFSAVFGIALVVAFLTSLVAGGAAGPGLFFNRLSEGAADAASTSWRRVWALTMLTYKEAFRRKALLVFVVFALLFMFAGWFLTGTEQAPQMQVKVYVAFVLTAISWLVLPVVMLLACWGLPQDIQNRSIHTVVTKPARRSEIVLGRMLGFIGIGTLLLAVMGAVGYVWTLRNFPAPSETLAFDADADPDREETYEISATLGTRINVRIEGPDGQARRFVAANDAELASLMAGRYPAPVEEQARELVRTLRERNQPVLVSRVPVYGSISFTDREGNPVERGINVGDIWDFRSYIDGATRASAIWEFDGISHDRMGDALVLESHFEAFRTHKGKIDKAGLEPGEETLTCQFTLRNDLRSQTARALAVGKGFTHLEPMIRQGAFTPVADELARIADGLSGRKLTLTDEQFDDVAQGFQDFVELLRPFENKPAFSGLVASARRAAADARSAAEEASLERISALPSSLTGLSQDLAAQSRELKARIDEQTRTSVSKELAAGGKFPELADAVAAGELETAAAQLQQLAENLLGGEGTVDSAGLAPLAAGLNKLADTLEGMQRLPEADKLAALAADCASAADDSNPQALAQALEALAGGFRERAAELEWALADLNVPLSSFQVREFKENLTPVRRTIVYHDDQLNQTRTADLYEDLVHGDKLKIVAQCLDPGQLLGMARPDLFIRTPDRPFASGYFKAVLGIWLMMVLVVLIAVTASTFLKGPVATLLTFTLLILGTGFHPFLSDLVKGDVKGGGVLEAAYRIGAGTAPTVPFEQSTATEVIQTSDRVILGGLWGVHKIVPDFNTFRMSPWVANGFDVPWSTALLPGLATTFAYLLPCLLIGYFALRLRELEAK